MPDSKVASINRALSGELHDILNRNTGLETRGLYDPRPLMELKRLRTIAQRRGCKLALEILKEAEEDLYLSQYSDLSNILQEDVSKLGIIAGNQERKEKNLEEIWG
jgi:predicted RNA polymerase sigma factor